MIKRLYPWVAGIVLGALLTFVLIGCGRPDLPLERQLHRMVPA